MGCRNKEGRRRSPYWAPLALLIRAMAIHGPAGNLEGIESGAGEFPC
jgi:hypothetical protein